MSENKSGTQQAIEALDRLLALTDEEFLAKLKEHQLSPDTFTQRVRNALVFGVPLTDAELAEQNNHLEPYKIGNKNDK